MKIEKFAAKMDLLGVLAFLYVIIYAVLALLREADFMNIILLIIGIGGFLIDFFVVIKTRLR